MSLKRKTFIEVPIVNKNPEDETKAEDSKVLDGKPNKKIIKLSEVMTNMDPLEYFSRFLDIPEMIFQHLSGKDLITASEVSPRYYNFIASSKVLMKKIKVVFDRDLKCELVRIPESEHLRFIPSPKVVMEIKIVFRDKCATQSEDFNLLNNSSRLYQNIEIKRSDEIIKDINGNLRIFGDYVNDSELDLFYNKAHEWKNVSLRNVYFRKQLDLCKLLSAIEASVESISVEDFGVLPFEDPSSVIESLKALKFPKLKKLHMFHQADSFSDTLASFLLSSVAIEELNLRDRSDKISKDILTKMFRNFDKLTSLQLSSTNQDELFEDESWKQFQFKLKSLVIGVFLQTESYTNFRNFLKSQSDYLENFTFPGDTDRETFDVILKMPNLKNLTLIYCDGYTENEGPIKVSTSITELTLLNTINAVTLKFLLDSMPKITNLTLKLIDEEHFKILKLMKRKFEKMKVWKLKGADRKKMEEIMSENYLSLEIIEII